LLLVTVLCTADDGHERERPRGRQGGQDKNEFLAALTDCVVARKSNSRRFEDSRAVASGFGMKNKNCCPECRAAVHSLAWPAEAQPSETSATSSTQPPLQGNTDANGRIFQLSFSRRGTIVRSECGSGLIGSPCGSRRFLKETALKSRIVASRMMQAA
jgi:hypothetical protein